MKKCKICGKERPDYKTYCDCGDSDTLITPTIDNYDFSDPSNSSSSNDSSNDNLSSSFDFGGGESGGAGSGGDF